MRDVPLTVIKDGINRLRTKGGARADSAYDLVNCFITQDKTVRNRPGTFRKVTLPAVTKGLTSFQGSLHTFSSEVVTVPDGYVLHVLSHPNDDDAINIPLAKIHFAKPFLGFLYVVAEFENGDIFHFWLQSGGSWEANKIYKAGDIVEPTTRNGIAYLATRLGAAYPSWAPSVPRELGDIIEPTEYNDYYYTVVDTVGLNPVSGTTEPDWPTEPGARIFEDTEGFADDSPTPTSAPTNLPTSQVQDRYNYGGGVNF